MIETSMGNPALSRAEPEVAGIGSVGSSRAECRGRSVPVVRRV
jgi:hypothetical protein